MYAIEASTICLFSRFKYVIQVALFLFLFLVVPFKSLRKYFHIFAILYMHFYVSRSRPENILVIVLTIIIDFLRGWLYYRMAIMFLDTFTIDLLQIKRILSKSHFF